MANFFQTQFIQDGLESMKKNIYRFEYQLNGNEWHDDATVNSKKIEDNKVVCLVNIPNAAAAADTITGVRFYDMDNELAGSKTVSLSRKSYQTGLIRFEFPLQEQTT